MRKTIWALALATVLAMGIGVPTASAATRTVTVASRYVSEDDTQNTNVAPLKAGDCTMYGQLIVDRPAADGFAEVRFGFRTKTSHTSNFDQWHNSWKIMGRGNQPIVTLDTIDGLRMPTVNQDYVGEIDTVVSMTTSQWLNIAAVTWIGSC
jgi:hypothetical protein